MQRTAKPSRMPLLVAIVRDLERVGIDLEHCAEQRVEALDALDVGARELAARKVAAAHQPLQLLDVGLDERSVAAIIAVVMVTTVLIVAALRVRARARQSRHGS